MTSDIPTPAAAVQPSTLRISDAERRGWQRRALAALSDLLDLGTRDRLTPLIWTLNHHGALVGDVVTPYNLDDESFDERGDARRADAMRATWQAWVDALHAQPWACSRHPSATHLSAQTTARASVSVILRARLPLPPDPPRDAA